VTATPDPPDGKPDPPKNADKADLDKLRPMVVQIVEDALKPIMDKLGESRPAEPKPAGDGQAADLAGMVDAAIAKVLGDRDAKSADDEHRKQHELLAAAAERKPVERPKRSKWLGSIWDKDA